MDIGRVELLVAASDLRVVQLIRRAIRNADAAVVLQRDRFFNRELLLVDLPEPRFLPRPVIHPTPYFAPRPVIHPKPRVESIPPANPPCKPAKSLPRKPAALEPPWAVAPWEKPIQLSPKIKINIHRTDVINKGSLLDFFI